METGKHSTSGPFLFFQRASIPERHWTHRSRWFCEGKRTQRRGSKRLSAQKNTSVPDSGHPGWRVLVDKELTLSL